MDPVGFKELLNFYADAGVDEALTDEPVDRFAETREEAEKRAAARKPTQQAQVQAAPRSPAAPQAPASSRATASAARPAPAAAVPDDAQAARAREIAANASTLDELRESLAAFDGCNLKTTAKSTVFSDGNPQAQIMLVGEAPGRDEDIAGIPFVGRSGKLLDLILTAIGLDRQSAYISNVIAWRPPGNRDPSPLETEICRPFIERHIELMKPKILVTLGNPSTKLLLRTQTGIMRMRGNWATHQTSSGVDIPTMPTLHPAYLLRNPAHKKLAWKDFLAIKLKLEEFAG